MIEYNVKSLSILAFIFSILLFSCVPLSADEIEFNEDSTDAVIAYIYEPSYVSFSISSPCDEYNSFSSFQKSVVDLRNKDKYNFVFSSADGYLYSGYGLWGSLNESTNIWTIHTSSACTSSGCGLFRVDSNELVKVYSTQNFTLNNVFYSYSEWGGKLPTSDFDSSSCLVPDPTEPTTPSGLVTIDSEQFNFFTSSLDSIQIMLICLCVCSVTSFLYSFIRSLFARKG